MIAMLIEDMLADLGCDVVATAAQLDEAVSLARSGSFDLAFLDLNLRGVPSYPVARRCVSAVSRSRSSLATALRVPIRRTLTCLCCRSHSARAPGGRCPAPARGATQP